MKKIYAIALMAFVGVASANAQAFKLDKNYVIKTAMKVADGKTVVNSETDGTEVTAEMLKKITEAYLDEDFNTLPISGGTATGANYHVLTADYTDPETGISFAAGTYATLNSNTEIKFKDTSNPQGVSNIKQVVFYLASQGQLQFYAREYNEDTDGENYVNFEGDPTNRKLKSYKAPGFQTETWTEMYFTKPLKLVVDLTNKQGTEDEMNKASLDVNKKSDDTEVVNSYLQFYEQATDADGKIIKGENLLPWTADRRFSVAFKKKAYVMGVALISATEGAKTMYFDITGDQTSWTESTAGINTINNVVAPANNRIYTLDGRFVGTDAAVLANGIYVQNGKKFVK